MAEASRCGDCGGKLGKAATKCRCGWVMPGAARDVSGPPLRPMVACCFSGCDTGALCRVWTATGWANVCKAHYEKVEKVPQRNEGRVMVALRKAYEGSYHYRQKNGGAGVPAQDRSQIEAELAEFKRRMEASLPTRQPGDDDDLPLGIGKDPLETEFEGAR